MTNVIAPVGTAVASMGRRGSQSFDGRREHDEPTAEAALLRRLDPHEPQGQKESSVSTLEASSAQVERPQAK